MKATEKFDRLLSDHTGVSQDSFNPDSRLVDDIGCDALDVVQIAVMIEEEFCFEVTDEEMSECVTVGDVHDMINGKGFD